MSWAHYYDSIYYVLKRHLNFSHREIERTDIQDIMILIKRFDDEQNDRNIWEMSLRGFDPKKVPAYREYLGKKSQAAKVEHLNSDDATAYKNIFDTALKGIKGGRKNSR